MNDLISRQAAIDAILAVTGNSSVRELYEHVQEHGLSDMWSGGVNAAIDIIIELPSAQPEVLACGEGELIAQPERKKGKWIKRDVPRQIHGISCSAPNYQCSVCKKWWFHNGEGLKWYKFCPECGADMRGDDHDL